MIFHTSRKKLIFFKLAQLVLLFYQTMKLIIEKFVEVAKVLCNQIIKVSYYIKLNYYPIK